MKKSVFFCFLCAVSGLYGADFAVTVDKVADRWPWESKIDIDFTVTSPDDDTADVVFSFANGTMPLFFPRHSVSGRYTGLPAGSYRVSIDPQAAGYTNTMWRNFSVSASVRGTPLYLVVDLTKEKGEEGQITYISKTDLLTGQYGAYEVNPVSGVESIIWTGVTNDVAYKTTKLAMRHVPAGTFMMGVENSYTLPYISPTNEVTLTSDYYIGVFETTQKQWELVMGSNPSFFTKNGAMRPVEGIQYSQVRGMTADADWPTDGYGKAAEGSFLRKMCEKTGLVFDLPTYAQWQYASAYTVTGYWFNNKTSPASAAYWERSDQADAVARYSNTAGETVSASLSKEEFAEIDTDRGTAIVGSYAPSVLGIYDMHGNIREFLLDWAGGTYLPKMTDPAGPQSGETRMWCGGAFNFHARYMKLGYTDMYSARVDGEETAVARLMVSGFRAIVMPE